MLKADNIAKLFGTQDNFNMLKTLLNQTGTGNGEPNMNVRQSSHLQKPPV